MLLAMTFISAAILAAAATDLAWKGREDADLRRRWRARHRQPWPPA
jgi:hypothetical protein